MQNLLWWLGVRGIGDRDILNSEQIPAMLGFIVLQASCNLEFSFSLFLASEAGEREAEIVVSFTEGLVAADGLPQ